MRTIKRWATKEQLVKLVLKFEPSLDTKDFLKQLEKFKHGDFVLGIRNGESYPPKKETLYFLKLIHMQEITLPYSNTPGTRKGRELLISNLPMPNYKKFVKKKNV